MLTQLSFIVPRSSARLKNRMYLFPARLVVVCVSSVLLSACVVPLKKTVYEPTCVKEDVVPCRQQDDKLVINLSGGATININAHLVGVSQEADSKISVCIGLQLDRGSTFQLLSPKVALESSDWSAPKTTSIRKLTEMGPRFYSAEDVITSSPDMIQDVSKPINKRNIALWLESAHGFVCESNIPIVTEFTFYMPDVSVNGRKIQIPAVHFVSKKRWVVEGLCC